MISLFSSKKEEKKIGKGFVPIEKVREMLDKGFTEIEIIDTLRKEGFSADEIDKALTEAYKDIVSKQKAPETAPPSQIQQITQPQSLSQQSPLPLSSSPISQSITQPQVSQPLVFPQSTPSQKEIALLPKGSEEISLEEYLDALIKSNLEELNKRLMEITLKQKEIEEKIFALEDRLAKFEKERKDDLERILLETRNIKENINDAIVKIEALSKTIKELLPTLVEAVKLLSEIVQKSK